MKQFYTKNSLLAINALFSTIIRVKRILGESNSVERNIFMLIIVVLCFAENTSAQCSIITSRNTTGLSCGTSSLSNCGGVLYIGDGTNAMTLTMTSNLDLTCLGPIRFIIRNGALVDFSSGNYNLDLAAGSSIEIENGGKLGAATNCSASDLITIGIVKVASCNGGAASSDFPTLVSNAGYSQITASASPSSFCSSGTSTLTAIASPSNEAVYRWYDASSGGNLLHEGNSYNTGTITASKTYYVEAVYSSYTTVRKAVTVSVYAIPVVPTITSTAASCSASGSTNISNYASANIYTFTPTGPTVGAAGLVNGMTIGTIYTVRSTNGICTSEASLEFSIVAPLSIPTTPSVGTITHPDCKTNTGSVVLNNLPASGTINQTGNTTSSYEITGATMTVSGLAAGTYKFTVTNANGCKSAATPTIVINPATTNIWNGTTWSKGAPTHNDQIVFEGNYTPAVNDVDIEACSCTVSENANVIITKGRTLKIKHDVNVASTAKLTFENNASLIQIDDDATNSGSITYQRTTSEIKKTDYVYWSSPVIGATLAAIQTGTLYYSFNAAGNSWVNANANTIMDPGKGYIVRGAGTWFDAGNITLTANFVGAAKNGVVKVSVSGAAKSNLIGNPYPSAIDADAFLEANSDVLEGTLLFWTHASAIQLATNITNGSAGSGTYAYTSDDYSTYNRVGGTAAATGVIAAGQSFFATGKKDGTAVFNNSMRLDSDKKILDNCQFLKSAPSSKSAKTGGTNKIEKHRIWLSLSNSQGAFKQLLVGYVTGATNDYDGGYDGISYNANSYVDFYSINNNSLLTIQGRALPIPETDAIPLGYSSVIDGDFTISIDKTDGLLNAMDVFLEDKLSNTFTNLKAGNYTFATKKGICNDRFILRYINKTTSETIDFKRIENGVMISNKNKIVKLHSEAELIDKVMVYDLLGRQLYTNTNVIKSEYEIRNLVPHDQVLIVKVILQNGQIVNKKIIY